MPVERFAPNGPVEARGAIVLLPGFIDGPDDFVRHGFVDIVRREAPDFDVFATNAHYRYYQKGLLWERLDGDVVGPLATEGYREIWLVGISMGGFGSLSYAYRHPDQIDTVILLAPYLGPSDLIQEIAAAGSLEAWEPGDVDAVEDPAERLYRGMWSWLKQRATGGVREPPIYVGYGEDDRLGLPVELLRSAVAPGHITSSPGGHKWAVWGPLFEEILPRASGRGRDPTDGRPTRTEARPQADRAVGERN